MAEEKQGLFKRLFRFGKKSETPEDPATEPEPQASSAEPEALVSVDKVVEAPAIAEGEDISEPEPAAPSQPEPAPAPEKIAAPPASATAKQEVSTGWLSRLRRGLSRSSGQLTGSIAAVFTKRKLDEDALQDLEDLLIQADLGIETAMKITDSLSSQRLGKDVTDDDVKTLVADEIETVLEPVAAELELDLDKAPHVILVVGVNGSGKTTTIGKLGQKLYDAGFSTLLVAGDTFRAAAIEQLKIWGERTLSPVVHRPIGSDAAGLAFDAYSQAVEEGRDVMLMDTAGRLQNKTELMDELAKIIRVLKKQDPTAPHTVLLTLDATTGQNALNQVEIFKDVAGVNGLVMTKLDGTARGGIMVAVAARFKLPVYFIGVGEGVADLEPFEARDFARSIAGLPQE
ncbi:MAG: signal recognition particle-docking protein FtsY [Pseudomonadota bacterium]